MTFSWTPGTKRLNFSWIYIVFKSFIQVLTVKSKIDITKIFNSKKRNLNNNSNTEEDAKRLLKENPEVLLLETAEAHGMFLKKLSSRKVASKFY